MVQCRGGAPPWKRPRASVGACSDAEWAIEWQQVFVRTLAGRSVGVCADLGYDVSQLAGTVAGARTVPQEVAKFVFGGRRLEPGVPLRRYGITKGSTICLTVRAAPFAPARPPSDSDPEGPLDALSMKMKVLSDFALVTPTLRAAKASAHARGEKRPAGPAAPGQRGGRSSPPWKRTRAGAGAGSDHEWAVEWQQVFVRSLAGRSVGVCADLGYDVSQLLGTVPGARVLPREVSKFVFGGRRLEPGVPLRRYGITKGSTIHLAVRAAPAAPPASDSDSGPGWH